MAEIAEAYVSLLPSARGFGSKLKSSIGRDVNGAGKSMGGLFSKAFGAAAALGVGAAVGGFLKGSLEEAREAQKVGAQTAAVLKSTEGAANTSRAAVERLAAAISRKTGIDDEAIQSGQNLLLTFTNVRNEAGRGNKIFNQATQVITDMSVALKQDMGSSAVQLGKALNDPIKGITALSRVGVSFTVQQKDQIKALVDSGKTLEAQKIILRELTKEFGGSAVAQATAGDKMRVAFGNIQEAVGTALLPLVDRVANAFVRLAPRIEGGAAKIGPLFSQISDAAFPLVGILKDIAERMGPVADRVGKFIRDNPTFVKAFAASLGVLSGAIGVVTLATTAFSIALNSTGIPIVIIAIAALVAGLVVAYKRSEDFRNIVDGIAAAMRDFGAFVRSDVIPVVRDVAAYVNDKMKPVFKQLGETIRKDVVPTVNRLVVKFRENQPAIQRVAGTILRLIAAMLKFNVAVLSKVLPPLIRFAGFLIRTLVPAGVQMSSMLITNARRFYELGRALVDVSRKVVRFAIAIGEGIQTAFRTLSGLPGRARAAIGNLGSVLYDAGRELIGGLISGITSKINDLRSKVSEVAGIVRDHFPGSPVKTGPLRSFNRGRAGQLLVEMLGGGIEAAGPGLSRRVSRLSGRVGSGLAATGGLALVDGGMVYAPRARGIATNTGLAGSGGLPPSVILQVGDRQFTAYVREVSDGSVGDHSSLAAQRSRALYAGQPA